MESEVSGFRIFSLEDQLLFAALSGDHNPIHVDPIFSRRLQFGEPVVHGMASVLWALDGFMAHHREFGVLRAVKATFVRPIPLDTEVRWKATGTKEANSGRARIDITVGPNTCARVNVHFDSISLRGRSPSTQQEDFEVACDKLTFDQSRVARGMATLSMNEAQALRHFGHVIAASGPLCVAVLLAITRIVGMKCPGLHSLLGGFEVEFQADDSSATGIEYWTAQADPRFRRIVIGLKGPGIAGSIEAFFRPDLVSQAGAQHWSKLVKPGEFASVTALVVGGSRGLGEATSKLLAAGGARVLLTYARGAADGDRVVREIVDAGGRARAFFFDVLRVEQASLDAVREWPPTHLAYFATPHIQPNPGSGFDAGLYSRFAAYYVTGFAKTCMAVGAHVPAGLTVLCPSSSFVESPVKGFAEYAAAKAGAESLGRYLEAHGSFRVIAPRLPPARTDQTAGRREATQEAGEVMLPWLRSLATLPGHL
jgi:acyl dehydratase/NAD(P)-dependent dehydrogenase (short-subunit alcohol dehydrogenase family)